jgi:signal transduction histidine kinase
LISDKKDNELETSQDISLETKVNILDEIKIHLETIVKSSNTPIDLKIDNGTFKVITAKSENKIYGVLGIDLNRDNKDVLYVETISQLKFLSSLISIVLERLELEEINEHLLISEEQNRIAREIHDSVCQRIFAINCMIHTLKQKCDKVSYQELKKEFEFIGQSLNKANKELRTTIYDLSLKGSQSKSFKEEMEDYIRDIAKLNSIKISFKMTGNQEIHDQNLKKAVYRIISESIGNSVRHGKCCKVQIILNVQKEHIKLEIADDGIGFEIENRSKGLGIQNMYNIINYSNGEISIESIPGKGTSISILIPNNVLVENIKGEVI